MTHIPHNFPGNPVAKLMLAECEDVEHRISPVLPRKHSGQPECVGPKTGIEDRRWGRRFGN